MEEFRKNKMIKSNELKVLNKCRLYLKIFTLSDITSGDGKSIVSKAWTGKNFQGNSRDTSQWPIWGMPTTSEWIRWRFALKSTFCEHHDRKLNEKLENWIMIPKQWKWFIMEKSGKTTLVQKVDKEYNMHTKIGRSNLAMRFSSDYSTCKNLDKELLEPTTVTIDNKQIRSEGSNRVSSTSTVPEDMIREDWLNIERHTQGSTRKIARTISNGTSVDVSDGSFTEWKQKGSA